MASELSDPEIIEMLVYLHAWDWPPLTPIVFFTHGERSCTVDAVEWQRLKRKESLLVSLNREMARYWAQRRVARPQSLRLTMPVPPPRTADVLREVRLRPGQAGLAGKIVAISRFPSRVNG